MNYQQAVTSGYKTKTTSILPIKGIWEVGNGGRSFEKNNHYSDDDTKAKSQKFAYDFAKPHKSK